MTEQEAILCCGAKAAVQSGCIRGLDGRAYCPYRELAPDFSFHGWDPDIPLLLCLRSARPAALAATLASAYGARIEARFALLPEEIDFGPAETTLRDFAARIGLMLGEEV